MDEAEIKVEVLSWVRRAARSTQLPVIASEFSLAGTNIRADLALLSDCFIGIEIKSASDTLRRLPSQMRGYARYFDHTILVVAAKHCQALAEIPLVGAGVWRLDENGKIEFQTTGTPNQISERELLNLLTQEERRRALRQMNRFAESDVVGPRLLSDDACRTAFIEAFRSRYAETSASFWNAVQGRRIRREDLTLLSRFHSNRERWREAEEASNAHWANWVSAMTSNAAMA